PPLVPRPKACHSEAPVSSAPSYGTRSGTGEGELLQMCARRAPTLLLFFGMGGGAPLPLGAGGGRHARERGRGRGPGGRPVRAPLPSYAPPPRFNLSATSFFSAFTAIASGVTSPCGVFALALGSAPRPRRRSTISIWPPRAAQWRAVWPLLCALGSAPASSRSLAISRLSAVPPPIAGNHIGGMLWAPQSQMRWGSSARSFLTWAVMPSIAAVGSAQGAPWSRTRRTPSLKPTW